MRLNRRAIRVSIGETSALDARYIRHSVHTIVRTTTGKNNPLEGADSDTKSISNAADSDMRMDIQGLFAGSSNACLARSRAKRALDADTISSS